MRPRNRSRAGARVTTIHDAFLSMFRTFLEPFDRQPANRFLADVDWRMKARQLAPNSLPCLAHLDRAARIAGEAAQPMLRLLAERRGEFRWGQTYKPADFGQRFTDNYGWLELFGTRGHFDSRRVAAGLLVLGPGVVYPDHHHVAEEIYIPLTGGTEWRMAEQPFRPRAAGETIYHASNVSHAMRTGAEPLVALYLWRGGPLAARSTVTGSVARHEG